MCNEPLVTDAPRFLVNVNRVLLASCHSPEGYRPTALVLQHPKDDPTAVLQRVYVIPANVHWDFDPYAQHTFEAELWRGGRAIRQQMVRPRLLDDHFDLDGLQHTSLDQRAANLDELLQLCEIPVNEDGTTTLRSMLGMEVGGREGEPASPPRHVMDMSSPPFVRFVQPDTDIVCRMRTWVPCSELIVVAVWEPLLLDGVSQLAIRPAGVPVTESA